MRRRTYLPGLERLETRALLSASPWETAASCEVTQLGDVLDGTSNTIFLMQSTSNQTPGVTHDVEFEQWANVHHQPVVGLPPLVIQDLATVLGSRTSAIKSPRDAASGQATGKNSLFAPAVPGGVSAAVATHVFKDCTGPCESAKVVADDWLSWGKE